MFYNPVLPVYAADPHAELLGDRFYIYATNAGIYSSSRAFHENTDGPVHGFAAWSSADLQNWQSEGPILRFSEIAWTCDLADAWAPCIAARNGRYYFYFCVASSIGVAVGDSPIGPFRDALGGPLVPFRADMSAIDPMTFIDDDGQAYLYWGAVPGAGWEAPGVEILEHLSVRRLDSDMISLVGPEIPTISTEKTAGKWGPISHIEASHVFKRNGIYYLMWSPGGFETGDDARSYRVHYATSSAPLGPWKIAANNPVLSTRREIEVIGPGHHSTLQIPGTDEWFCVYHCHKGQPLPELDRRTFIDHMFFDSSGAIETIVPTLQGPPRRPVRLAISLVGFGPFSHGAPIQLETRTTIAAKTLEFFSHKQKIGEIAGDATRFDWPNAPIGFHRLRARATLTSGEILTSAPLDLDVI